MADVQCDAKLDILGAGGSDFRARGKGRGKTTVGNPGIGQHLIDSAREPIGGRRA